MSCRFFGVLVSDLGSFDSSPTFDYCERLAHSEKLVEKKEAQACESAYPDDFVADSVGRRKVWFHYVEYTWGRLWTDFWG